MTTIAAHLRADELLRLIDDDTSPLERSQFNSHLLACARCSEEAATLRDDAALFSTTLRTAAFEHELPGRPPFATIIAARDARTAAGVMPLRRRWSSVPGWARAAAVLLIVAGPVAAVPAWRDWIVDALTGRGSVDQVPTARQVPEAATTASSPVTFVIDGPAFVVQFDAAQANGELRIRRAQSAEASLVVENAATELPIYSENTLRIRNASTSAASYVLELPASVGTVTVRIGAVDVRVVDGARIATGVVVPLRQ
jgi:anti-sigma factor RsiW